MIVQCDKCKTKFRIADEKVTDTGVKVRCSRCAHVFMVTHYSGPADQTPGAQHSAQEIERALRETIGQPGAPTVPNFPLPGGAGVRMGGTPLALSGMGPQFSPPGAPNPPGFSSSMPAPLPLGPAPSRIDMNAYAPVAPSAIGGPQVGPSGYPIPSRVPEPPPRSSTETRNMLGFSSAPADDAPQPDEVDTQIGERQRQATIAESPGLMSNSDLARQLQFEDDPTASYGAFMPLSATLSEVPTLSQVPSLSQQQSSAPAGFDEVLTRRYPLPPFGGQQQPSQELQANPFGDPNASLNGAHDFVAKPPTNPNAQAMSPLASQHAYQSPFAKPASGPFQKMPSAPGGGGPTFGVPTNPNAMSPYGSSPGGGSPFGPPPGAPSAAMTAAALFGPSSSPIDAGAFSPQVSGVPQGAPPSPFGTLSGQGSLGGPGSGPFGSSLGGPGSGPMSSGPMSSGPLGSGPLGSGPLGGPLGGPLPPLGGPPGALNPQGPFGFAGPAADPPTSAFFPPPPDLAALIASAGAGPPQNGAQPRETGDIPGLLAPGATSEDPFAGLDLDGPSTGQFIGNDPSTIPGGTPFDGEKDKSTFSIAKANADQALARIDLGGRAGAGAGNFSGVMATTRVSTALPFPRRTELEENAAKADTYGRWPTIIGLAIGLTITIAAVTGPAGGDLSKLGPDDLTALISPALTQPIPEGLAEVRAHSAHVTTYTTKSGRNLLVIAGDALNEGETITGVEAIALVLDGENVVERREAPVGVILGEDALTGVSTAEDLEAAYAEAAKGLPKPPLDTPLKSGSTLPFMVVFPNAPMGLEHRAFAVEFRRANEQPSARSP